MRPLLTIEEYLELVLTGVPDPVPTSIALERAFGCVLAASLTAPFDLPPFPSSAMDGFAVRSADLAGASEQRPVRLRISGEVRMGAVGATPAGALEAVAVPTGGRMPDGADAVVPFEQCRLDGSAVTVGLPFRAGKNVRPAGEDLSRGAELVAAGRRMEAAEAGALAAAGFAEVPVYRRPTVVIVSTGDELADAGTTPGPGQIFESNSLLLRGCARRAGADAVYAGRVPDDPAALLEALASAAEADVFVCSGGVSAGRDDPVRQAFAACGDIGCVQVSVQPGRPQAFGTWLGKPFFGLPGNPMAALVSFELFVRPALHKMLGLPPACPYLPANLTAELEAAPDAVRFVPVTLQGGPVPSATPFERKRRSNQLATLARADGLAEVPAGVDLGKGSPCRVLPIRER
jgi:molybdopterin molybdotransferase